LPWQPGVKTAAGDWSGLQDKISKLTAGNSAVMYCWVHGQFF